jgi:HAD superfamily hydrolase (TIGR01484 family)
MSDNAKSATKKIAAVLADVDGTLVTKNKVMTPRSIEAIKQLQQRSVLFAITSGRPPRGMRMLVRPLEMHGPMAAFNGGIIVLPDMSIVDERVIPTEVTKAVIDAIEAYGLYVSRPFTAILSGCDASDRQ